MDRGVILSVLIFLHCKQVFINAKLICNGVYRPLEVGKWKNSLKHLDSGVVENKPTSEGQVYVYENDFPGYTIKYIHVDNLAIRTCGARAEIKSGGVGQSTVLIVIHAKANNEIRAVVDIWGVKAYEKPSPKLRPINIEKNVKSLYVLKSFRMVNHNLNY